jgi:hypothetical protein
MRLAATPKVVVRRMFASRDIVIVEVVVVVVGNLITKLLTHVLPVPCGVQLYQKGHAKMGC